MKRHQQLLCTLLVVPLVLITAHVVHAARSRPTTTALTSAPSQVSWRAFDVKPYVEHQRWLKYREALRAKRAAAARRTAASGAQTCQASHYGYDYRGVAFSAASKEIQHGRHAIVTAPNGRSVTVLINDSGPYVAGRCIDLSRTAFVALGYPAGQGVINGVRVEPAP